MRVPTDFLAPWRYRELPAVFVVRLSGGHEGQSCWNVKNHLERIFSALSCMQRIGLQRTNVTGAPPSVVDPREPLSYQPLSGKYRLFPQDKLLRTQQTCRQNFAALRN
ncbi:hypothetical protein GJ744_003576 [Endocarpon pusillum]|uniref:Uncharacterized protein n=1 Tax=Endocarpon pusillum TaxID=364733 RepID=A0A8H7E0J4_9EURO|nr:hypothetical protein GJ744_003576 [Endocarpon pusillum]